MAAPRSTNTIQDTKNKRSPLVIYSGDMMIETEWSNSKFDCHHFKNGFIG